MDFEAFIDAIKRLNLLMQFQQKELDKINKGLKITAPSPNQPITSTPITSEPVSESEVELLKEKRALTEELKNKHQELSTQLAKNYQRLETLSFQLLELQLTVMGGLKL